MTTTKQLPKLNLKLNIPDFTAMRITPPLKLEPIRINAPEFDYENSHYEPFSKQLLDKIGVKFDQDKGIISSLVSNIGCMSCTACKAMSRDTLMEINAKDLQTTESVKQKVDDSFKKSQETQEEDKKEKFLKIWKQQKKRHIRPSAVKFDAAYIQNHKLSEQEWEEKIKKYFQ